MTENTARDVSIKNFFIFHSKYGQKEGEEEEKIIYFYPKELSSDNKMKEVGLSEAIIKFIENFSSSPCEELRTEKTRKIFYEAEENIWIVMTINIPYGPRSRDVLDGMEYLDHQVKTPVFQAVVKEAYLSSRMILGPYERIINQNGLLSDLKTKTQTFFTKYLDNLKLKDYDIVDVFQGIEYFGTDKPRFLSAQSIVNQVEGKFPICDHSMLLFEEKLVWSGLHSEDTQMLYKYLVKSIIPVFIYKTRPLSGDLSLPLSMRFIVGTQGKERNVYLSKVSKPGFYHLIVYRVNQATLCLLSQCSNIIKEDFFTKLHEFLYDKINDFCKEVSVSKSPTKNVPEMDISGSRFIYFNSTNLATKTNLHERSSQIPVSKEALGLLVDINQRHTDIESECKTSEIIYKTNSDHWVAGMMSNGRKFFVTVDKKKDLLDASMVPDLSNTFSFTTGLVLDQLLRHMMIKLVRRSFGL